MKKILFLLLALMLCAALVACDGNDTDASETGSDDLNATVEVSTDAPTEEATDEKATEENSTAEEITTAELYIPEEAETLDSDACIEALDQAGEKLSEITNLTAKVWTGIYNGDNNYPDISYDSKIQVDGDSFSFTTDQSGSDSTVTVHDGVFYISDLWEGNKKAAITDEDLEALFSQYADIGSDNYNIEYFPVINGYKTLADGKTTLLISEISDEMLDLILSESLSYGVKVTMDRFQLTFILGEDMLPEYMYFHITLSYESDGVKTRVGTTLSYQYEYGNADVSVPYDAEYYTEYTFEDLIDEMTPGPGRKLAESVGFPLDGNDYEIDCADQEHFNEQYQYLISFAEYYSGKTFSFSGDIRETSLYGINFYYTNCGFDDERYRIHIVFADGLSVPEPNKRVRLTATPGFVYDEYNMILTYYMFVTDIQEANDVMYVTADSLWVRSDPDFNAENEVGYLTRGQAVEIFDSGTNEVGKDYYVIMFEGKQAYISANPEYISHTKPE